MKKILFALPHIWYVENYLEYIIRYLGNKYEFDIGIADGEILSKNPDDYDLIIVTLGSHRHFDGLKYKHKTICLAYEPNERGCDQSFMVGAMTPYVEPTFSNMTSLRMGIDTNIFYPYPMVKKSDKLQIGFVGKPHNPRRMFKDVILPLKDIEGVDLQIYVQESLFQQDVDFCGGEEFRKRVKGVHRQWVGLPNVYNQLDVMIRVDCDMGYSFPCIEAIACGVPIITSDSGIDKQLTEAGCGILIESDKDSFRDWSYGHVQDVAKKYCDAVIKLRDNRNLLSVMSIKTQLEVKNWTWNKIIPMWEQMFIKLFEKI